MSMFSHICAFVYPLGKMPSTVCKSEFQRLNLVQISICDFKKYIIHVLYKLYYQWLTLSSSTYIAKEANR